MDGALEVLHELLLVEDELARLRPGIGDAVRLDECSHRKAALLAAARDLTAGATVKESLTVAHLRAQQLEADLDLVRKRWTAQVVELAGALARAEESAVEAERLRRELESVTRQLEGLRRALGGAPTPTTARDLLLAPAEVRAEALRTAGQRALGMGLYAGEADEP